MYHTNFSESKSVLEVAHEYVDRGWNPIPVEARSKRPSNGRDWHLVKIDHTNVAKHFNGAPQNIGVQMGTASGGLVDVDLDCPEALALAPAILPSTDATFGRKSTPRSHWLYVTGDEIADKANIAFDDPNRAGEEARLLELRIGGGGRAAQTVFPPSVHKDTGELISWEKYGEPARLPGSDLLRKARLLAVCCLLARYWPPTGSGCHDAALAVGGFLARAGLRPEEVHSLIAVTTNFHNPDRVDDLQRTAADAATNHFGGERSFGLPQFAKIFGGTVAKQVAEWLGYRHKGSASGQSVPPPLDFEDWPDPIDLPSGLEKVPPLNPEILPENVAAWLEDIADRMQVPSDYVAIPAMVMFGSLIGNKIAIAPKEHDNWVEVGNLWGLVIGRPGFMKSPAASEVFKPMKRAAKSASDSYSLALAQYELQEKIYKSKAEAAIKKGQEPTDAQPVKPKRRVYVTNDTTYEKLCEILVENPHGVLVHRDEIVSMLRALRQEQSSNANGFFLQAWSGTQGYSSERITRGHIPVENACVSLFGTTQPGAISEFVKHAVVGDREDDGLIQRFGLTAWPDANPEWVNVDRYLNKDACDAAYELFDRLNSLVPAAVGATQDQYDDFPYLRFTPEAYQHFTDWRDTLERRVRGGNLPDALTSHLAKYRGLIPRLALITHLIDEGKGPVGEMSLIKALQWAEYLEPHAARVYSAGVAPARAGAKTSPR